MKRLSVFIFLFSDYSRHLCLKCKSKHNLKTCHFPFFVCTQHTKCFKMPPARENFQVRFTTQNRNYFRARNLGISHIIIQSSSIFFSAGPLVIEVSFYFRLALHFRLKLAFAYSVIMGRAGLCSEILKFQA